MGPRRVEQGALFYEFSLDAHVPGDHHLRSIDRSPIRVSRWSSHGGCLRSAFPQEALDFRGRSRSAE